MGSSVSSSCDPSKLSDPCKSALPESPNDFLASEFLPVHKLALPPEGCSKPLAAIYYSGIFCPIHRGHIDMLTAAIQALQARDYHVLGAYISPSSVHFARAKLGGGRVDNQTRLNLIAAAVEPLPLVMLDTAECFHRTLHGDSLVFFGRLEARLQFHLSALRPSLLDARAFHLFWLSPISSFSAPPCPSIVVVDRPGYADQVARIEEWIDATAQLPSSAPVVVLSHHAPRLSARAIRRRDPAALARAYADLPLARALLQHDRRWAPAHQAIRVAPAAEAPPQLCLTEADFRAFLSDPSLVEGLVAALAQQGLLGSHLDNQSSPRGGGASQGLFFPGGQLKQDDGPASSSSSSSSSSFSSSGANIQSVGGHSAAHIQIDGFSSALLDPTAKGGYRMGVIRDLVLLNTRTRSPVSVPFTAAVIKTPASPAELAAFMNEANFYLNYGCLIESIQVPLCYAAQLSHVLYLALEDISANRRYSFPIGENHDLPATVLQEHVRVAVRDLARFHAHFWNDNALTCYLNPFSGIERMQQLFQSWSVFYQMVKCGLKKFNSDLTEFLSKTSTKFEHFNAFINELIQFPFTIVHGNIWVHNLSFANRFDQEHLDFPRPHAPGVKSDLKLSLCDWGSVAYGPGLVDLVSIIDALQMTSEEPELLRLYHDTLLRNGVDKLEFRLLLSKYKLAKRLSLIYRHQELLDRAVFKASSFNPDFLHDIYSR